jgi:chemotaxis protein MotD
VRQSQPAPLPQSSPVQQIVDRIAAQLVDAQRSEAQPAQSVRSASLSSGAPLRVLSIQLQPADLGTVTVRMSLKEDTLELQLEAANPETARLISKDREALSGLLRSAGYLIDGLSVQVTEPDRTTASAGQQGLQGTQTLLQSSTQSQSGSSQPDARSSNPHQQAAQHNSNHPASGDDDGSDQHAARPVDGALYV